MLAIRRLLGCELPAPCVMQAACTAARAPEALAQIRKATNYRTMADTKAKRLPTSNNQLTSAIGSCAESHATDPDVVALSAPIEKFTTLQLGVRRRVFISETADQICVAILLVATTSAVDAVISRIVCAHRSTSLPDSHLQREIAYSSILAIAALLACCCGRRSSSKQQQQQQQQQQHGSPEAQSHATIPAWARMVAFLAAVSWIVAQVRCCNIGMTTLRVMTCHHNVCTCAYCMHASSAAAHLLLVAAPTSRPRHPQS